MGWFKKEQPSIAAEIGKLDAEQAERQRQEKAAAGMRGFLGAFDKLPSNQRKEIIEGMKSPEDTHAE